MMKIPKYFELMGTKIEVIEDANIMQDNDARGKADFRLECIRLAPDNPVYRRSQSQLEHTFLHELVHWIFFKLNKLSLGDDEDLVDMIADLLHQAIESGKGEFNGDSF
jgi:predicted SprT family Zn-dependent metalloprotease